MPLGVGFFGHLGLISVPGGVFFWPHGQSLSLEVRCFGPLSYSMVLGDYHTKSMFYHREFLYYNTNSLCYYHTKSLYYYTNSLYYNTIFW